MDPTWKHDLSDKDGKLGGLIVNRSLFSELTSILSKDESLDLCSWLANKSASYSADRATAIDFALHRSAKEQDGFSNAPRPRIPVILWKELYPTCNLMVIRPLDASVHSWAEGAGLQLFPQRVTNMEFHDRILQCDVIASKPSSTVVCLTPLIALKVSRRSSFRYLKTYEYIVKQAPKIPVANLLGILATDRITYTFMRRVPGVSLDTLWGSMGLADRDAIHQQLVESLQLLRAISRPCGNLVLGLGRPPYCLDTTRRTRMSGEQLSESDFNPFLPDQDFSAYYSSPGRAWPSYRRDYVMTHGNLHPRKIMVSRYAKDGSIKIEAILNWEMSGWYPRYWEYLMALNNVSDAQDIGLVSFPII